ncbi:hypothetical protein [Woodsholea maritima]|uniref:hypothetical protein n=1 Tax=Woodsholea maritima TaxID=240237 RepID=UPI000371AD53|nr:hypothetical protein [Woodsholea maritima]
MHSMGCNGHGLLARPWCQPPPAFAKIFFVTYLFRMSLFFLMGGFIKNRLSRATLPLMMAGQIYVSDLTYPAQF